MQKEDDLVKLHSGRAAIIGNLILFAFLILFIRLWYLQIYRGDIFHLYSVENLLRKEVVKAPRGMIFSRNNNLLVHNVPRFDAIIIPQYLKNKNESLKKVAKVLDMPLTSIQKIIKKNSGQARYRPILLKKNISKKEVSIIETESYKMPGVMVDTFIGREYALNESGAHLIGYISEISPSQLPKYRKRDNYSYKQGDFIGKTGVEEQLDLDLRGFDGHQYMEVDAYGRMRRLLGSNYLFKGINNKNAQVGNNIRLTIDQDLQKTAFNSLGDKVGSVVMLDIHNGDVLAMASTPSFDPTKVSRGLTHKYWNSLITNPAKPMIYKAIQEHYAPGSTFKVITSIAALEEGIISENTKFNCPGFYKLGNRKFHCWKRHGHGEVSVTEAIRESCDVFFYMVALKLDIDTLAQYAKAYGFGSKTGIKIPREISGLIPNRDWKLKRTGEKWQKGETLSCVIGQSFVLSTPLQLALSYAAIANEGSLYRPKLVKDIFSNSGEIISSNNTVLMSKLNISKKTLKIVKEAMRQVVNNRKGTAWWYKGEGIRMAGKTGTSQVRSMSSAELFSKCEEREYKSRHHAIFSAFAPYDNPKVAISVVVEHGCHGSSAAAPVARDVITAYMDKYFPDLKKQYTLDDKKKYAKLKKVKVKIE
ncbi:MAG: penicillin-binding protein 2 [Bdellovibrionales bacterium]|jgi:penicillin-binding protein 2|nr:penicillin-binding protein 2 [Bdellovibrionales bacterium]